MYGLKMPSPSLWKHAFDEGHGSDLALRKMKDTLPFHLRNMMTGKAAADGQGPAPVLYGPYLRSRSVIPV